MLFQSTLALAIAATASAAVVPRTATGSWFVTFSRSAYANGYQSETTIGNYTSDSYPAGIVSKCFWEHNPAANPTESTTCDNGFSYSWDSSVISLSQVVELPVQETVFGSAPLTVSVTDSAGRTFGGNATVQVTSAIA